MRGVDRVEVDEFFDLDRAGPLGCRGGEFFVGEDDLFAVEAALKVIA